MQVIGISKKDYPKSYEAINKLVTDYGFKNNIYVKINKSSTVEGIWGKAGLLKDYLKFTRSTLNLLESMDQKEIESIIAHELSHIYHRDEKVWHSILIIYAIPLFVIGILFPFNYTNIVSLLLYFIALFIFIFGISNVMWFSQGVEHRSDMEDGARTKDLNAFKGALKRYEDFMIESFKKPNLKRDGFFLLLKGLLKLGASHPMDDKRFEYFQYAIDHMDIDELKKVSKRPNFFERTALSFKYMGAYVLSMINKKGCIDYITYYNIKT